MDNEYMRNDDIEQVDYEVVDSAPVEPPRKEQKRISTSTKIIALALSCSLLGGAASGGLFWALSKANNNSPKEGAHIWEGELEEVYVHPIKLGETKTAAEVYAQNVGATVGITTSITTNFWGFPTTSAASGSGFILSDNGYILTNFHVIEGSNAITVTTYDDIAYEAKLVGYDESNDIAVLKVEAENLQPVILGDSDKINVGDDVVAIGNPLGELTFSLTAGAISAKDRRITLSSGTTMNLIQTDCAINSGNSGGALFNMYGEVIGVTNAKYSGNGSSGEASIDNIGFAIPLNDIRDIVESIIEKGYVVKPYIGVSVTDVSQETQAYGLPQGAAVRQVVQDSPAEKAGLQINDIITKVNDKDITGSQDLVDLVGKANIGDVLTLEVFRQGQTLNLTMEVGERIQSATQQESQQQPQYHQGFPNFGFEY